MSGSQGLSGADAYCRRRSTALEREKPAKALRREIEDVGKRLQRYYDAFESGAMDPEDMGERVKKLRLEKKGLEGELARRTTIQELPACFSRPKYIEQIRGELRGIFANGNQQLKKRYLRILLESIVVDGDQVTVTLKCEVYNCRIS